MNALLLAIFSNKVLPVIIPPLLGALRKLAHEKIPPRWIPAALAVGGAAIGTLGGTFGVEVPDLTTAAAGAWDGVLIGLASNGVHQLWANTKPAKKD